MAAGEVANVSVHGANRLGGNSLLETVVFGARAGRKAAELAPGEPWPDVSPNTVRDALDRWNRLCLAPAAHSRSDDDQFAVRLEMAKIMTNQVGVFRTGVELEDAVARLERLRKRYRDLPVPGGPQPFNYGLMDYIEVGHLLDLSEIIARGALARRESRGAHYRLDFPQRDDQNWLHHTFARATDRGPEFSSGPVSITRFQPQERGY